MDLPFPEKYHQVAKYFNFYFGDLETSERLTDVQRLMFYALRQQAEHGPCTTAVPSFWHMTERHKHQAWKQLGCISKFEAMVFFVQQLEQVLTELDGEDVQVAASSSPNSIDGYVAAPHAVFDWSSRLQEMNEQTNRDARCADVASLELEPPQKAASTVYQGSSSLSLHPDAEPAPSMQQLSAEEMQGWDADVASHAAPTSENILYLATELMQVRKTLRHLQNEKAALGGAENGPAGSSGKGPPLRYAAASAPPISLAAGPPLKQMYSHSMNGVSVPIIPPHRPSARGMTEAAMRVARGAPSVLHVPHADPT